MAALASIESIIRDLLIFVVAMTALLIALLVIVSRMPNDNPLKRMLVALSYRVGATAAAGMIALPAMPFRASTWRSTSALRSPSMVLVDVLPGSLGATRSGRSEAQLRKGRSTWASSERTALWFTIATKGGATGGPSF